MRLTLFPPSLLQHIAELVAEMMIATNQVAGLYAAQHGLFVPYRHQAAPHEVDPDLLRELDGT
jgi:exoribonuclease R